MTKIKGLILLDGPDCAGKTSLAKEIEKLAKKLGAEAVIHHLGKPVEGTCWDIHGKALIDYLDEAFLQGKLIIADRHFLSEGIYGCSYRAGSEYPHAARHVDRLMHRFRALRVICCPPVEQVVEVHAKMKLVRFEEYSSGMDVVAQRYLDLWHGATEAEVPLNKHWTYQPFEDYLQQLTTMGGVVDTLGWYHYDYTQHDTKTYARMLIHELETELSLMPEELLNPLVFNFTGFPSAASVLLVGDQLSNTAECTIPFYANSGSSLFLAESLQKIHVDESRLVIANINEPGGITTVRLLSEMCGRTIALGRNAEKTLISQGIPYDAHVRHPQHARRFSYHSDTYSLELFKAFDGMGGV